MVSVAGSIDLFFLPICLYCQDFIAPAFLLGTHGPGSRVAEDFLQESYEEI